MTVQRTADKLTDKDFATDQEVRWCPGCGDYAILKALQRTLPTLDVDPDKTVFVSGIGCSSRFPYYMQTYGFHTIHGRAPAIATGVKLTNPELDVWVITGDGDGLSIGGGHMLHALRRNVDLQILLFNNEIYGLTKGQYSPTSHAGTRSPSTPFGSVDASLNPCAFALGAGARFVARSADTLQKHLPGVFARAHGHRGTSFVEIFQNCIVYNDNVFGDFLEKDVAADNQLLVEHGRPMRFGKDGDKGLRFNPRTFGLEAVTLGADGVGEDDILVHDETNTNLAQMLVALRPPAFPMVMGVIYCDPAPTYESEVYDQLAAQHDPAVDETSAADQINGLLRSGRVWKLE